MRFVEAFTYLGYQLDNHQNEWSAESDYGVCITLWKSELKRVNQLPFYELDLTGESLGADHWTSKSGHKKRLKHLIKACDEFDGQVDVVLLDGPPGGPYKTADPWDKVKRGFGWTVTFLNRETGAFRVEIDQTRPFSRASVKFDRNLTWLF